MGAVEDVEVPSRKSKYFLLKQKLFVDTGRFVFSTGDAVLDAKKDLPNHTRSHRVGYICTSFVPRRLHATIPMLSVTRRRPFW